MGDPQGNSAVFIVLTLSIQVFIKGQIVLPRFKSKQKHDLEPQPGIILKAIPSLCFACPSNISGIPAMACSCFIFNTCPGFCFSGGFFSLGFFVLFCFVFVCFCFLLSLLVGPHLQVYIC